MLNSNLDIFFKIKESIYLGVTIRATHQKTELFYHYPWGSKTKASYGNIGNSKLLDGYLPDHISFHNDGNIHTKSRDGRKKKIYHNSFNPGLNVFDLENGKFLPILLESINLKEDFVIEKRFKKIKFDETKKNIILEINNRNFFSIILISKCKRLNPEELLKIDSFENLTFIGSPIIWQDIFKSEVKKESFLKTSGFSTELVIMVVDEILNTSKDFIDKTNGAGRQASTTICMPPMKLIGSMINKNKV